MLLTLLSVLLAAAAVFAYANAVHAEPSGAAQQVLVADASGSGAGRWHWVDAAGNVGDPLSDGAVIVPGDMVGFVTSDGMLTETRFSLPHHAGNETQGQQLAIPDGNEIYALDSAPAGELDFARSQVWLLFATGSALSLAGGIAVLLAARYGRSRTLIARRSSIAA